MSRCKACNSEIDVKWRTTPAGLMLEDLCGKCLRASKGYVEESYDMVGERSDGDGDDDFAGFHDKDLPLQDWEGE